MYKNSLLAMITISSLLFPSTVFSSPKQEELDNSIIFMGRICEIEIQFGNNVYEKKCDRLVITGAERKEDVNFHFDDSDNNGFSFIINPQGKKVVENNYLLLNKYKALATFIWTQEEGVVQESVVGGEGACQILKDKVLCVLQTGNAEDNFRANAYFEF